MFLQLFRFYHKYNPTFDLKKRYIKSNMCFLENSILRISSEIIQKFVNFLSTIVSPFSHNTDMNYHLSYLLHIIPCHLFFVHLIASTILAEFELLQFK